MKLIRTVDAAGQVLCHDITQIIPGEFKGPRFRKGHIVQPEDIPVLLQGNVFPLAADQITVLGTPTIQAITDTARFLKEQGKVDAVLPDYAPSVNASFITQ